MADEATGGQTRVEVPQAQRLVPRRRERELAVGRDGHVRDEAVVAVQDALRVAVGALLARDLPCAVSAGIDRSSAQRIRVLSREAVRRTSGSSVVAMAVTQPPWPASVPRKESVSDMVLAGSQRRSRSYEPINHARDGDTP